MTQFKWFTPGIIITLLVFQGNSSLAQTHTHTVKRGKRKVNLSAYKDYIESHKEEHLKEYLELVSIPSISSIPSHKPDATQAAQWIVDKLKRIGIAGARLIPTEGNPVVFGSWDQAPGKPTVLIYAHYDVQPVKESEWDHPPFSPIIQDDKILGRGASDDKSGILTTIWAAEALLQKDGKLPVNVKFMFEGNEEMGSPYFRTFLENNKEILKADFALNADDGQYNEDTPALTVSLRGSIGFEFTLKTASTDAHSGEFGGKTPNALVYMAKIINSFYDRNGNVAVEGFYDKVIPISAGQKELIKKIPYDPKTDMKILGTKVEVGDTNFSSLERIWYRPTLEITGLQGGYTAPEGQSNIVPGSATAKINCRLVKNQNGNEIVDLIVKHIHKFCPDGAELRFKFSKGFANPMTFPTDTKEYRYISEVLSQIYGKEPFQYGSGGSVGAMLSIKEVLGIYAYPLGFELSDEKWHASNEFFRVSSMQKGQLIYCYYLQHLAEEESKLRK